MNDVIIYDKEKTLLQIDETKHFILMADRSGDTLLDIMAYLSALPNFIELNNADFNNRLHTMYQYFDICNCLLIRENVYEKKEINYTYSLLLPILKNTKRFNLVEIEALENEEILNLYHTSLKQFEPLPRCIMLYRVVECAFDDYKKIFKCEDFKPENAIEYFWNEANNVQLNPLYCVRYEGNSHNIFDLIKKLKKESKKIIVEWQKNKYLRNKSIGEVIYQTGRNFSAHGANKEQNARYDYGKNYKHINNVKALNKYNLTLPD